MRADVRANMRVNLRAMRLRKWLRTVKRVTARPLQQLWQRVRSGAALRLRALLRAARVRSQLAAAPAFPDSAPAPPSWRAVLLPPQHPRQRSGVRAGTDGRRVELPLPRALAAEPCMQLRRDIALDWYDVPQVPGQLDARLAFFARRCAQAPREGRALFAVLVWSLDRFGVGVALEVPGVFRSRGAACALARGAAYEAAGEEPELDEEGEEELMEVEEAVVEEAVLADEEEADEEEGDAEAEEEVVVEERVIVPRRVLRHRHGALLYPHAVPVQDNVAQTYARSRCVRYDVVPIACDPPLGPPFSAAAPSAAAAAMCAGAFQPLMRTFLLCCARLARTRGMPPLPSVLMCRIVDDVASSPQHRPRIQLALSCRLLCDSHFPRAADVSAHFAVPAALPRATAAAQAFVDTWAEMPDHDVVLPCAGGEWEECFAPEHASLGFDAACRVARRATHAAPCRGHAPESVLADLVDAANSGVRHTLRDGTHACGRPFPPSMALLELPVDTRVGVERPRSADAQSAAPRAMPCVLRIAAAADPAHVQRVLRRADAGPSFRTWDGQRVAALCPLYDLLSPAAAVLCEEAVCDACGASCEAEAVYQGGASMARCLRCLAVRRPPGTLRGWRPAFTRALVKGPPPYESPCRVTGCTNMRTVRFPATADVEHLLPPGCRDCMRAAALQRRGWPDARPPAAAPRVDPETLEQVAPPRAPPARRPRGWQPPPAAPRVRVLPADTRTPYARGVRLGWVMRAIHDSSGQGPRIIWIGPCDLCGVTLDVSEEHVPWADGEEMLCSSCKPCEDGAFEGDDAQYLGSDDGEADA
jgi:hypothetical protein